MQQETGLSLEATGKRLFSFFVPSFVIIFVSNQFSVWNRNGKNEKCIQLNGAGMAIHQTFVVMNVTNNIVHYLCRWHS
jgi:hypothetical protein